MIRSYDEYERRFTPRSRWERILRDGTPEEIGSEMAQRALAAGAEALRRAFHERDDAQTPAPL